jgi:hypothetical protein
MNTPETSPLFTRWCDPVSGVESLILSRRAAPIQQSFYYTNPSFSSDGRFLWFRCAFPPGGDNLRGRQLAVVDFVEEVVRHFPETEAAGSSPYVDLDSGEAYWTIGLEIWKRGPLSEDEPIPVGIFPKALAHNRRPHALSTHLTFSADKKSLALDPNFGRDWFIGDFLLDGSGEYRLWQTFDRCYNHAQFSPTDPDLILIAQDSYIDILTGEPKASTDRLWLIRRGEKAWPILPDDPLPSANRGHEWWDSDGDHVWYLDYSEGPGQGTKKVNIHTGQIETIWPHGHSHSHCDRTGRCLVGDIVSWPNDAWQVAFFNAVTGKEVSIVTLLPPCSLRSKYHIHPHPQFCMNDQYICYTTNVLGTVDVALTNVAQLLALTQ